MQGVKMISTFVDELRKRVFTDSNEEFPRKLTHSYIDDDSTLSLAYMTTEENKTIHHDTINRTPNRRITAEGSR